MTEDEEGNEMRDDEPAATWVDIGVLHAWKDNPRKNDGRPVEQVAKSIERFGFGAPILARMNGEIIAGHTRWKAAQKIGLTRVPVRYLDLDPAQAKLLALADNKTAELADWDDDLLRAVLADLHTQDVDLVDGTGFDESEIARLLEAPDKLGDVEEPGDLEPPPEPQSRAGEAYELGPHRLVCGDACDAAVWATLLGTERAQLVWTDPPYGVGLIDPSKVKRRTDTLTIKNDTLDEEQLEQLLRDAFGMALGYSKPGASWYVAAPPGPRFLWFGVVLRALDIWHQTLVWEKDQFVQSRNDYQYRYEPIFYGWAPGAAHFWCGDRTLDTILKVDRPKRSVEHPTMKPLELVEFCIRNSSEPGWLVCDPFGGSGTTLLAAARQGRIARLIELDPGYCDVIRKRWTQMAQAAGVDPGAGALS